MTSSDHDRYDRWFWSKVEKTDGCWVWTGNISTLGYGDIRSSSATLHGLAHRYSYEALVGPIPDGLGLDHLCRNRACVNPAHLEPVTNAVNILRGESPSALNARKTHCAAGHPFDEANTYITSAGARHCRACNAARMRKHYVPRNTERQRAFEDVQRFIAEMLSASRPGSITHAIYSDLASDMENLALLPSYTRLWPDHQGQVAARAQADPAYRRMLMDDAAEQARQESAR